MASTRLSVASALGRVSRRNAGYTPMIKFAAGGRSSSSLQNRSPDQLLGELRSLLSKDQSIAGVQQLSNEWFALADKDSSKSLGSDELRGLMTSVGLPLAES
ncbi:unnamed protein product, partial [Polarella glacialis]